MFGINKLAWVAVNNIITGITAIIRGGPGPMVVNLLIGTSRLTTLVSLVMLILFIAPLLLLAFLASGIIHTGC
jgi:hypothetical protein